MIYLVVTDAGIFYAGYDLGRARRKAQAVDGTVSQLPILEDYRPTEAPSP